MRDTRDIQGWTNRYAAQCSAIHVTICFLRWVPAAKIKTLSVTKQAAQALQVPRLSRPPKLQAAFDLAPACLSLAKAHPSGEDHALPRVTGALVRLSVGQTLYVSRHLYQGVHTLNGACHSVTVS